MSNLASPPSNFSSSEGGNLNNSDINEILAAAFDAHNSNDMELAESLYRRCLELSPDNPKALHNLGVIGLQTGNIDAAIKLIRHALKNDPNFVDGYCNLGLALKTAGHYDIAEETYRKAISIDPNAVEAHSNLGILFQEMALSDAAHRSFKTALQLAPGRGDLWSNLAVLNMQLGNKNEAVEQFVEASKRNPENPEILSNLGSALTQVDKPEEALSFLKRALRLDPNFIEGHYNLGKTFFDLGELDKAVFHYRFALKLEEGFPDAHHNLGHALLALGNLEEGWVEYGWRWKSKKFTKDLPEFSKPLWAGERLTDSVVFIWSEQGIGDQILFGGLIPELEKLSKACIVETESRLVPLFARSFPASKVVEKNEDDERGFGDSNFDIHAPMGDLPRWLRPRLNSFKSRSVYLIADSKKIQQCRSRYISEGKKLVGVSWASRPPKGIPLSFLMPVFLLPDVTFVNLQYGDHEKELEELRDCYGVDIIVDPHVDPLLDIDSFAAQVAAMDAVITVQNTTLYVAGGLGIKTFALLPPVPDWRWMGENSKSLWHDKVQLYIRTHGQSDSDQKIIIGDIAKDLKEHFVNSGT